MWLTVLEVRSLTGVSLGKKQGEAWTGCLHLLAPGPYLWGPIIFPATLETHSHCSKYKWHIRLESKKLSSCPFITTHDPSLLTSPVVSIPKSLCLKTSSVYWFCHFLHKWYHTTIVAFFTPPLRLGCICRRTLVLFYGCRPAYCAAAP
jgi:hypothetical protein